MADQIFCEEHEIFRRSLRGFLEKEVKPHLEEWRKNRQIPREIWRKMGDQGFIGYWLDEKYGGLGADLIGGKEARKKALKTYLAARQARTARAVAKFRSHPLRREVFRVITIDMEKIPLLDEFFSKNFRTLPRT